MEDGYDNVLFAHLDHTPTPEAFWEKIVDDAKYGSNEATRCLLSNLILTLKGEVSTHQGESYCAVNQSAVARQYLVEILQAALDSPAKKVSDALRITMPALPKERGVKHKAIREKFLNWYRATLEERGLSQRKGKLNNWDIEQWSLDLSKEESDQLPSNDTLNRWVREARFHWSGSVDWNELFKGIVVHPVDPPKK